MISALGPPGSPSRFGLIRALGDGAMGVVYEAHDRETDRRIALKTLRGGARYLRELKREFRLVQSVAHPNLVRLGALYQAEETWFFTMELLDGVDFLTWVRGAAEPSGAEATRRTGSTLRAAPVPEVIAPVAAGRIARLDAALPQLGAALAALHGERLVHRDVKPSNAMVTAEGRVVLLDFGLIRALPDDAAARSLAGTPAYMAPEQAAPGPVTPAADCYAVGVLLYQALTGRLPFVGPLEDVLYQKRTATAVAPRLLAPDVPAALEALCLRLLSREPGDRPTAAELAAWRGGPAPRPPGASTAVFIGRSAELAAVEAVLARAPTGPAIAVIEGESGIGKTALLGESIRRFAGEAHLVLRGRCFEREVAAYPGIDMMMDALAGYLRGLGDAAAFYAPRDARALCRLFPALADVPGFTDPGPELAGSATAVLRRAARAFHELFARLATRTPVVVALDDAHWLNDAGLRLLDALLGADDPVGLVVLLAARPARLGPLARWLGERAVGIRRIALGPLSHDESLALLRQHTSAGEADLDAMARDSAGHPFLVRELALAGCASGASWPDGAATSGEARVDDVLRRRAAALGPRERRVLDLICSAVGPVPRPVVARASGLGPALGEEALEALIRQRWAVASPGDDRGAVLPAHDRVRSALGAALAADEHIARARELAEALEVDAGANAEAIALQWSRAGDHRRAARPARIAADQAMAKLAFESAAALYGLALRGTRDAAARAELLAAQADAHAAAGDGARAAEALLGAAALRDGQSADDLVVRAADQLIRSGQVVRGKQLLAEILARLGLRWPASPGGAVRALVAHRLVLRLRGSSARPATAPERHTMLRRVDACWPAGDLLAVLDPVRAAVLHTQGLALARAAGEPYRLARALCTEAAFVSMTGRRGERRARAALAHARQLQDCVASPLLEGYLALGTGVVELQLGQLDIAQRELDRAEAVFERCPGTHWETGSAREFALWTLAYRGGLRELAERFDAALAICDARRDPLGAFKLRAGPSRLAMLARDQPHALLAACALEPLGLTPDDYPFLALCALFGQVNASLYLGHSADALSAIGAALPAIRASHLLHSQFNRVDLAYLEGRAALARAAESSGAERRALVNRVIASERALRRERVAWADALSGALHAGRTVAALPGDRAHAGLRAAADQLAQVGLAGYAAAIRWQLHHRLGADPGTGDRWQAAAIARPDRLSHALAPLLLS